MYMARRDHTHIKAQREGKERDGYICQICGSHDHVEGHHLIDYQYETFLNEHSTIEIYTTDHIYTYKLFSTVTYDNRHILDT